MRKTKETLKFEFTISGFIIGLILVSMFASVFAILLSESQTTYSLSGENSLQKYNQSIQIQEHIEEIKNKTSIKQESGWLDVIGGFFTAGYGALQTSATSLSMFYEIFEQGVEDVPYLAFFKQYLIAIVIISIFVGILIGILVKGGKI